ncbi:GH25 family lysozyme [Oceaniferula spumae]
MRTFILSLLPTVLLFSSCAEYGKVSYEESPKIINVSHYDPKEKQRSGRSYSPSDQSALKANGAHGLIARCAKGPELDSKCSDFLAGADRQGLLLGSYYYLLPGTSPSYHAERFINRLREIKASRGIRADRILLVADIDTNCRADEIVAFVSRVQQLTGKYPVVYLENGSAIRRTLQNATGAQKSILRKCPYWLALYSNTNAGLETPQKLADASGVWNTWCMWQYGGVWWKNGRSQPYNYRGGSWKTPKYFGNLDRPTERNGFNGSLEELRQFWFKQSWVW